LWFDDTTGTTFVYVSSSWVEIGPTIVDDVLQRIAARGDLVIATSANSADRLPIGDDGYMLIADSSTNEGARWSIAPTIVDYVVQRIAARGDLIVATSANEADRLGVGDDGDFLIADSASPTGLRWSIGPTLVNHVLQLIAARGDLIIGTSATSAARLPVGNDGEILVVDSAEPSGVRWAAASQGPQGATGPQGAVGSGTADTVSFVASDPLTETNVQDRKSVV
jgi:hypothetical protein